MVVAGRRSRSLAEISRQVGRLDVSPTRSNGRELSRSLRGALRLQKVSRQVGPYLFDRRFQPGSGPAHVQYEKQVAEPVLGVQIGERPQQVGHGERRRGPVAVRADGVGIEAALAFGRLLGLTVPGHVDREDVVGSLGREPGAEVVLRIPRRRVAGDVVMATGIAAPTTRARSRARAGSCGRCVPMPGKEPPRRSAAGRRRPGAAWARRSGRGGSPRSPTARTCRGRRGRDGAAGRSGTTPAGNRVSGTGSPPRRERMRVCATTRRRRPTPSSAR